MSHPGTSDPILSAMHACSCHQNSQRPVYGYPGGGPPMAMQPMAQGNPAMGAPLMAMPTAKEV